MQIVTVMHDFRGGGAEKVGVLLANEFARSGIESEIVCASEEGPVRSRVSEAVRVTNLHRSRFYSAFPGLVRRMRDRPKAAFISHLTHVNVAATAAARLTRHRRVLLVEHNDFCGMEERAGNPYQKAIYMMARAIYPHVPHLVAVSESVLRSLPGPKTDQWAVIENPFDVQELEGSLAAAADHPWFSQDVPVLVACGRLAPAKNYPMMLEAIAALQAHVRCRLIVLGEGPERSRLKQLASSLGIDALVDFPGFVSNPMPYFARARLFLSTSDFEGLPMTFIEALYAGADLVATESCSLAGYLCQNGRFGTVVPVGNVARYVTALRHRLTTAGAPISEKRGYLEPYEVSRISKRYTALLSGDATDACFKQM